MGGRVSGLLYIPAALICVGVLIPISYLLIRAFGAEAEVLVDTVFRTRNLRLLGNTLLLLAGVLGLTTMLALPLAWITEYTDFPFRRTITVLAVLPLAIPSYVIAYTLLGLGGPSGVVASLTGITVSRMSGYPGAVLAISIYAYPYLFLNLKSALSGLDNALLEVGRSFGYSNREIFIRTVLPQLRPAFLAGFLIVGLHVLGNFGAVSLMRFETFSYALYLQTASFDRIYASWLALMLLSLTGVALWLEARALRNAYYHRATAASERKRHRIRLGRWKWPISAFLVIVFLMTLLVPLGSLLTWIGQGVGKVIKDIPGALADSLIVSAPAGILAGLIALPVAYLSIRNPSRLTRLIERISYLGYAVPPLAFGLAFILFSLGGVPFLYQTIALLVIAYTLHFQAEAIGPVRSTLYQMSPRIEEAARTLGSSPLTAFWRVTVPALRGPLVVGMAFVFLACMKELPITFLLAPPGLNTLALKVWTYSTEAMFAEAAPFALAIVMVSAILVAVLLKRPQSWST